MKVLQVSPTTGSFVYMLEIMFVDVSRWLIFYCFGALAFAAGVFVLYRNNRAAIGIKISELSEECMKLDTAFHDFSSAFLFLVEITLDGGGYWGCFRQSNAEIPGMLIFAVFTMIMMLMLVNTLIAMMAQTFQKVQG